MVKLSVLDYALIDEGKDAQKALQDSVTLAKLADRLGFKRIWFTEHHMYQRLRVVVQNF
ncbi:Luciferase-like monooxygenase [Staphylococcus aureus]|uniref:Luciferase-like monooxygenase n=1 Tax=Staphylococcus aureus TaxID=1280 RepID=A0A380DI88_STAAU|nr:Luciferase-like monooxygenase [Staphylococcus aureus]